MYVASNTFIITCYYWEQKRLSKGGDYVDDYPEERLENDYLADYWSSVLIGYRQVELAKLDFLGYAVIELV